MKPPVVLISSSSDDDGDDDEGDLDEEKEESEPEFSSEEEGDDSESGDQEYYEKQENDVDSDEEECCDDCDDLRDVCFNQGSNNVQELSLNECKAYLRKHGLRLSGTKEECTQRIREHERLKDGNAELLYPRSSFSINCKGDACKGDFVLFKQKVYNKFDNVAKRGNIEGRRTVAGRIIKESYGAGKQQHTFTIEVLWSKGSKKLPVLSILLVKGRNLYRFWTSRQPWKSEAERSRVLEEKHNRGDAARHKRKLKKIEIASNNDRGTKRQKLSHREPSRKSPTQTNKHKSVNKRKTVQYQRAGLTKSTQPTSRSNATLSRSTQPTSQSKPNHSIYSSHHLQEASSSSLSSLPYGTPFSLPNYPPLMFSGYGHHVPLYNNYAQPDPRYNYAPLCYYYEQPDPRYRLG